jgi:hypothetical protein
MAWNGSTALRFDICVKSTVLASFSMPFAPSLAASQVRERRNSADFAVSFPPATPYASTSRRKPGLAVVFKLAH